VRATGYVSAHNVMEEYAAATEEIVENLTEQHTKQLEALIKANNDNMAKLMDMLSKAKMIAMPSAATLGKTKTNGTQKNTRHGLRGAEMQQNASIVTNSIQTIPKLNAGNSRKIQPNSLLTGNSPSQVDGARDLQ
jgi:hypothetical protein